LCSLDALGGDLLAVALSPEEDVAVRTDAVRALSVVGNADARRRLVPLARDPLPEDANDDLKGAALQAICPSVLSASEALDMLTPQKQPHVLGVYSVFLSRQLPEALTDDELPAALSWVRRLPHPREPFDELADLAEQILVRGVEAISRRDVADAVVEIVAAHLREHHELQTFQTRDSSDAFTDDMKRRRLVVALLPLVREGRLEPVALIGSTPRLLRAHDLGWLLERLDEAPGDAAWLDLIDHSLRFEDADQESVMLAREGNPALFERTRPRFGPIELQSAAAAQMRARYREELKYAEQQERLAASAPDYDTAINSLLDRVEAGDLDAFWHLCDCMWGEPGRPYVRIGSSDLAASPGWERASTLRRMRIIAAAATFLVGYETSASWLEPRRVYRPATAGYRAVRLLAEHARERFDALGDATLCRWIPAIVTFVRNSGDEVEMRFSDRLVAHVAERCPRALADAVTTLLRAEAAHGEGYLFGIYRVRTVLGGPLGTALLQMWQSDVLPPAPKAQLLGALLDAGVPGAEDAGLASLGPAAVAADREMAAGLAATLLGRGGEHAWSRVRPLIESDPEWGEGVFLRIADQWGPRRGFRFELPASELAALFIWLSSRFPRHEDPSMLDAHAVGPREQVAEYRDRILGVLVEEGTDEALQALDEIQAATGRDLTYARIRAEEAWRLQRWTPPRPQDVVRLVADARRRLVRSGADLQRALLEALERIQHKLGPEGQAHQLWDTTARRPKRETEVSAWIADRLRDDLEGREIVINREVEVRANPRGGVGDRTDIHVTAAARESVEGPRLVTVVTEVKGCWHDELFSAMSTQLAADYLSARDPYGIYLVVWFGQHGWDDAGDRRRRACGRVARESVLEELRSQADTLRAAGYRITPLVLDASLR
jgi:hypothetical protein